MKPRLESHPEHEVRSEADNLNNLSATCNTVGCYCAINSEKDVDEILTHIKLLYKQAKFQYLDWKVSKLIKNRKKKYPKLNEKSIKNFIRSEERKGHRVYTSDLLSRYNCTLQQLLKFNYINKTNLEKKFGERKVK